MSYEGYVQQLCVNGHLSSRDAYDESPEECYHCKKNIIWTHHVDQTNGDEWAFKIQLEEISCIKAEACAHCGVAKIVEPAKYKIPTFEEVDKQRRFWELSHFGVMDDGHQIHRSGESDSSGIQSGT